MRRHGVINRVYEYEYERFERQWPRSMAAVGAAFGILSCLIVLIVMYFFGGGGG